MAAAMFAKIRPAVSQLVRCPPDAGPGIMRKPHRFLDAAP
jgi:hypothetical protein